MAATVFETRHERPPRQPSPNLNAFRKMHPTPYYLEGP